MIKHFHFDWRLLPVAVADLIIVRLMRSLALLSYFAVALCYATPPDVPFDKFDVGPPVHREGATTGYADMMQLGSTDYYADLLVSYYTDNPRQTPQFVTISVEKKWGKNYVVCFERQFRVSDVPRHLLTASTRDIATYDQIARLVTFNFGFTSFHYKLPDE